MDRPPYLRHPHPYQPRNYPDCALDLQNLQFECDRVSQLLIRDPQFPLTDLFLSALKSHQNQLNYIHLPAQPIGDFYFWQRRAYQVLPDP